MKKQPLIIFALLILAYIVLIYQSQPTFSDQPVELKRASPPEIVMFSSKGCKYCAIARRFFDMHHLPFTEHDIEDSDKTMQTFQLLGGQGTPLIIVNGDIIHGFDEGLLREAL
ncbi:MAG: glutaredoxin family protein [Gammaproteobacteria bacterium]|nr:glutaredoxin family protein [Gammaproteobacteria bacterium]